MKTILVCNLVNTDKIICPGNINFYFENIFCILSCAIQIFKKTNTIIIKETSETLNNIRIVTCAYYAQRNEADQVASSNMRTT